MVEFDSARKESRSLHAKNGRSREETERVAALRARRVYLEPRIERRAEELLKAMRGTGAQAASKMASEPTTMLAIAARIASALEGIEVAAKHLVSRSYLGRASDNL